MFDFDALSHATISQAVLCQKIVDAGGGEVLWVEVLPGFGTASPVDRAREGNA